MNSCAGIIPSPIPFEEFFPVTEKGNTFFDEKCVAFYFIRFIP